MHIVFLHTGRKWSTVALIFHPKSDFMQCFHFKGTNIKDMVLPESAPSALLLDKHIAFIISYSKKTDDYVRSFTYLCYLLI